MSTVTKQILLVEDNDADAGIVLEALADRNPPCGVVHFRDGVAAFAYLMDWRSGIPDVILLDLNMPKSDGLDVLRKIRDTPRLANIPVAILTGSCASHDLRQASLLGATRYVEKPLSYDEFLGGVRRVVEDMLQQGEQGPEPLSPHQR
jgi:two-component system response regulator